MIVVYGHVEVQESPQTPRRMRTRRKIFIVDLFYAWQHKISFFYLGFPESPDLKGMERLESVLQLVRGSLGRVRGVGARKRAGGSRRGKTRKAYVGFPVQASSPSHQNNEDH